MHRTDYLSCFYAAGRLVWEGRASDIYPNVSETSFATAPLNRFAHELLPHLRPNDISAYMYAPLVAWLMAPLSLLDPRLSMASWQLISMAALILSALLLARANGRPFRDTLWSSLLYLPIYHTLLIGHIGITFGLVPLCVGYVYLLKRRPFLAGFAWSFLLLKPQFLPVALLVAGALALTRRFGCAFGFITGLALIIGVSAACLSPAIVFRWIASHRFSDAFFTDPRYGYPVHLVSSLPAAGLHVVPIHSRDVAKLIGYGLAVLIGMHALWQSWKLLKAQKSDWSASLPLVFLLGIATLPLVVPHFLSYDLSAFAVAGILMNGGGWSSEEAANLKRINCFYLLAIDAYMALFILTGPRFAQPPLLIAVLIILYVLVLRIVGKRIRATDTHALSAEMR